jgi:hypothetical protein
MLAWTSANRTDFSAIPEIFIFVLLHLLVALALGRIRQSGPAPWQQEETAVPMHYKQALSLQYS